jgi:hypothetical protein
MQPTQVQYVARDEDVLAVSLELASKSWKVGLNHGSRASAFPVPDHFSPVFQSHVRQPPVGRGCATTRLAKMRYIAFSDTW